MTCLPSLFRISACSLMGNERSGGGTPDRSPVLGLVANERSGEGRNRRTAQRRRRQAGLSDDREGAPRCGGLGCLGKFSVN